VVAVAAAAAAAAGDVKSRLACQLND
jgi:hypothetical protein